MTMPENQFAVEVQKIRRAYADLGHSLGWRFLCVSKYVLHRDPTIVFLTLNPGGTSIPEDHPAESCEGGSAYVMERWGTSKPGMHKLQRQVQQLFAAIGQQLDPVKRLGVSIEESLVGYFVPFRSVRFADLHRPKQSLEFANGFWLSVLEPLKPRLLLSIDPLTFRSMNGLCIGKGGELTSAESLPTGWGSITADVNEYRFASHSATVLRLPHLSTFQLFSRHECTEYVNEILAKACKNL